MAFDNFMETQLSRTLLSVSISISSLTLLTTTSKGYNFQLNIFHATLDVSEIVEKPATTVLGVLNNVGGALGLVLGMSLLVVVEWIEFYVRLFVALFF